MTRKLLRDFGLRARSGGDSGYTSHQSNTHSTESREVLYPWHPWFGRAVWIYAKRMKYGRLVALAGLEPSHERRGGEVAQWMFDTAVCCQMRMLQEPVASVEALRELKALRGARLRASPDLCSAVIHAVHDSIDLMTPTTSWPRPIRSSIRDASRRAPISRGRAHPPPIDGGSQILGLGQIPSEDPAHRDPTRCEDALGCNESSTLAGSLGDVPRTSESANRGILFVLSRSRARKSNSPSDSQQVIASTSTPKALIESSRCLAKIRSRSWIR